VARAEDTSIPYGTLEQPVTDIFADLLATTKAGGADPSKAFGLASARLQKQQRQPLRLPLCQTDKV
jgi:hypothetical protein